MIDLKRAKAICEEYNRTPAHAPTARTDFAMAAAEGWPAALEEIERLRDALVEFRDRACDNCLAMRGLMRCVVHCKQRVKLDAALGEVSE